MNSYDDEKQARFKTIEIVVSRKPWQPPAKNISNSQIVGIRIAYDEVEARKQVKADGGKWNLTRQVWQVCYERVIELGMKDRLVNDEVKSV